MKYIRLFEGRKPFSEQYKKGDLLLVDFKCIVYNKTWYKKDGTPPLVFPNNVVEVMGYIDVLKSYTCKSVINNQDFNVQANRIIKKIERNSPFLQQMLDDLAFHKEVSRYNL
jgi:hypothetical protein